MENLINSKLSFEPMLILEGEQLINRLDASDGLIMEVNIKQGKAAKAELRHENFHCTDLSFTANLPSFSYALRQGIPPENIIKEEVLKVFYMYSDLSPAHNIASSQESVNETKQSLLDLEHECWTSFFTGKVTYMDDNIVIEVVVKEHPIVDDVVKPAIEKYEGFTGGLKRNELNVFSSLNLYDLKITLNEELQDVVVYIIPPLSHREKIVLTTDTPLEIELSLGRHMFSKAYEFLTDCQITVTANGVDKENLIDNIVRHFQRALHEFVTCTPTDIQSAFKIELVEK